MSGGEQPPRRLSARLAAAIAAVVVVIIVVSVAAGVILQRQTEIVPVKAAGSAAATVTVTARATPLTPDMRVSLIKLCSYESIVNSQSAVHVECPVVGVSVPVDGHRFAYQSEVGETTHSSAAWHDWIGFRNSDCTHLHLLFALDDQKSRRGDVARVRVVRQSGTTSSKTTRGKVGVLDAPLDGDRKPFRLSSHATHSEDVYMRGYVVCPRPR